MRDIIDIKIAKKDKIKIVFKIRVGVRARKRKNDTSKILADRTA